MREDRRTAAASLLQPSGETLPIKLHFVWVMKNEDYMILDGCKCMGIRIGHRTWITSPKKKESNLFTMTLRQRLEMYNSSQMLNYHVRILWPYFSVHIVVCHLYKGSWVSVTWRAWMRGLPTIETNWSKNYIVMSYHEKSWKTVSIAISIIHDKSWSIIMWKIQTREVGWAATIYHRECVKDKLTFFKRRERISINFEQETSGLPNIN